MADFLLVDGYNIIHAWNELKKLMDSSVDHARLKLIDLLANYQAVRGIKVIVVFDAHLVRGGTGSKEEESGVEVVFTSEGETADMLIEKLVSRLMTDGRVTVATSDWAQQRIVFGKGAVRLSARELVQELSNWKDNVPGDVGFNKNEFRNLYGYLDENARRILERIRRQK